MCGIGGIVRFDAPASATITRAREIQRRLRHRGPDQQGEAVGSHASLIHTRLVLRDEAGGRQPFHSPDGRFTLVFNGEIFDLPSLCRGLALRPRTGSEAEILLEAWIRLGTRALPRLNGMFAFFVWDDLTGTGHLVRDRLGVKPAAYSWDGTELRFASEAQALLPPRPRAHIPALLEYLVAPCFSGVEHSMFDGIDYLQPGHLLQVSRAGIVTKRWAEPPVAVALRGETRVEPDVAVEDLRAALAPAVQRTLAGEAGAGVFLSGGLDSTIIASAARDAAPPCFTIAFQDQAAFDYGRGTIVVSDDQPFVEVARRELGLRVHTVSVARERLAADLAAVAAANDALPAWEQELAQHHLAGAASRSCKAVLVGDAADETHYGYHFLLDDEALAGPEVIIRRLGPVPVRPEVLPDPVAHFGARYRALLETAGARFGTRDQRVVATTLLIQQRWLPRLLHNGDIHTMRWSLEARVPFGDRDLLEAAERVPPALALRDGVEKWALREAARGLVPERIRVRKKSALPKDQLTQDTYQQLARALLVDPPAVVAELVSLSDIEPLLTAGRVLSEQERAILFRVIALGFWARHHGVST